MKDIIGLVVREAIIEVEILLKCRLVSRSWLEKATSPQRLEFPHGCSQQHVKWVLSVLVVGGLNEVKMGGRMDGAGLLGLLETLKEV